MQLLPDQRRSRGAAGVSCVKEQGQQASPSIRNHIRRYAAMCNIEGLDGRDRYTDVEDKRKISTVAVHICKYKFVTYTTKNICLSAEEE